MGKFNEYTQKATPADNDTMMIYDAERRRQTSFHRSAESGTGLLEN